MAGKCLRLVDNVKLPDVVSFVLLYMDDTIRYSTGAILLYVASVFNREQSIDRVANG